MTEHKIITVFGATGAQGGGLARAILSDPSGGFKVRAVTRNTASDKAKAIRDAGAEVVAADLDSPDQIDAAMQGAYGAFCVTFFWEHFSPVKESHHAANLAEAAKRAELRHVIWSTLEDTRRFMSLDDDRMPTLQDKYKVPHFDAKGEADQVFKGLGLPVTLLVTSFYWDNMIYFGIGPKKGPDGKLALTYPMGDKKLPGIAVEDIGKCAYGIFKNGSDYIGKTVGICGEQPTIAAMAAALTEALGVDVGYNDVPPDVYRGFGFPGADDMGNMFQFKRDFNDAYCAARSVEAARRLNPSLLSFKQWLAKYKDRIPLE